MGCTPSKQSGRDLRRTPSPARRSVSFPVNHKVDGKAKDHTVSLMSSTIGFLELEREAGSGEEMKECTDDGICDVPTMIVKAKVWSETIAKRIPKTPTETPPNEPESIDARELMAGLDGYTPPLPSSPAISDRRSFSFYPAMNGAKVLPETTRNTPKSTNGSACPPLWTPPNREMNSISTSDFDPKILSTFRKAMEELSPLHPSLLRSPESKTMLSTGTVRARITAFQERIDAKKRNANARKNMATQFMKWPVGGERKMVLYFTSLRGVRKTYEECCLTRTVLKGYGFQLDERDVSMDRGFREELRDILRADSAGAISLPRVFANGRYLGGFEEVKRLHEDGELEKEIEDCDVLSPKKGNRGGP